ncbi:hypothetical protein GDO86_015775 [Hymenochirus boettgeri]|uniref:Calpain catalytic domain-containing protein n=1 Tax=Hymenochirus boettgeri TaxID=247094 RepID=A0A8T2JZP0_9PIPI|nr:hypothetical protein GDO86_015775 [Hymenochirus boettgeri]
MFIDAAGTASHEVFERHAIAKSHSFCDACRSNVRSGEAVRQDRRNIVNKVAIIPFLSEIEVWLNGSYEALDGGFINEAFVDFTGGLDETIDLNAPPPNLFHLIQKAVKKRSLLGASIEIQNQFYRENVTPQGLVKAHAYSIIATFEMELNGRKIKLLRLRNPWGKVEWTGPWCDNSPSWSQVDFALRKQLQVRGEDGEFWIQMEDFLRFFNILEVCNLTPDSLMEDCPHPWNTNTFLGRWVIGHNAGTFWTNPQFLVNLTEEDEDTHGMCTLLVSLMQRNRRQQRSRGQDFLTVGFEIYQVRYGGHIFMQ